MHVVESRSCLDCPQAARGSPPVHRYLDERCQRKCHGDERCQVLRLRHPMCCALRHISNGRTGFSTKVGLCPQGQGQLSSSCRAAAEHWLVMWRSKTRT